MVPVPAHRPRSGFIRWSGKIDEVISNLRAQIAREEAAECRLRRAFFSIHTEVLKRMEQQP